MLVWFKCVLKKRFLTLLHFNGTKTTPVAFCCFRLVAERTSQLHGGDCCWQYYVSDITVEMDGSPEVEVDGEGSASSQEAQVEVSADIEASVKVTRAEVATEVEGQEGLEVEALEAQFHPDGTLMTGKRMSSSSKRLYHYGDLSNKAKQKARSQWR